VTWAVFLDRDGVVTDAPVIQGQAGSPRFAHELQIVAGAEEAVSELRRYGARLFVVTNQPDVARGTLDEAELIAMHDALRRTLDIDDVRYCPHDGADACSCRKPAPGMLVELANEWAVDLDKSWMVGDRWVDIAAGAAAGTHTVLVERSYSWSPTSAGAPPVGLEPDHRATDLSDAAGLIARMSGSRDTLT
jgi:D-glycero-D-manno-heptose 1,7-bisphosphate phosphatase